jgi:hypothetical protein
MNTYQAARHFNVPRGTISNKIYVRKSVQKWSFECMLNEFITLNTGDNGTAIIDVILFLLTCWKILVV